MIMNEVELYNRSNELQKRDAHQVYNKHGKKVQWNSGDRILDIGCGDGSVMTKVLAKYIPIEYKKFDGCDISVKMIKFANDHYKDQRTSFFELNIEGHLPDVMRGTYDRAFSFYTLNWIMNQRLAYSNIFNLLTEGGDCLLTYLGRMPVYDVFKILARTERWSSWLKDLQRVISPYHDIEEPEKEIREIMKSVGFKNIDVIRQETEFSYDTVEEFKDLIKSVNTFPIPKEFYEEYLEDYVKLVKEGRIKNMGFSDIENSTRITMNYDLLIVYGSKS